MLYYRGRANSINVNAPKHRLPNVKLTLLDDLLAAFATSSIGSRPQAPVFADPSAQPARDPLRDVIASKPLRSNSRSLAARQMPRRSNCRGLQAQPILQPAVPRSVEMGAARRTFTDFDCHNEDNVPGSQSRRPGPANRTPAVAKVCRCVRDQRTPGGWWQRAFAAAHRHRAVVAAKDVHSARSRRPRSTDSRHGQLPSRQSVGHSRTRFGWHRYGIAALDRLGVVVQRRTASRRQ